MFPFGNPFRTDVIPEDHDKVSIGTAVKRVLNAFIKNITADAITTATLVATTITGSVSGFATNFPSTAGPTSGALSAAMSGRLCIGVVDAVYTLPSPTGNAGVWYTIVTGVASAGTGLAITATSTLIQGKTNSGGTVAITNATTITNSGASDVVGDYVTLRCDGTNWWVVGQSGTYAGS